MRKMIRKMFLAVLLLSLIQVSAMSENLKSSSSNHFVGWEKLNLPLKNYLENLKTQKVDLIIRANKIVGESEKSALKEVGFQLRSVIPSSQKNTTLLTGSILPSQVEKLAALSFVEVIELSSRLQYQEKVTSKKDKKNH